MTQSKEPTNQPTPQEQESSKSSLNRREFIVAGAAAASALAFPGSAQARGRGNGGGGGRGKGLGKQAKQKAAEVIEWDNPFKEPEVFSTETLPGSIFPDLSVEEATFTVTIPNPDGTTTNIPQTVRTYNGSIPGPTYKLKPGEKLELDLINNLGPNTPPPDDQSQNPVPTYYADMNCQDLSNKNIPGCFNTTNLHTHGLHVSPKTKPGSQGTKYDADSVSSDDVHVRIPPANDPNEMDVGDWLSKRHYCFQLPEFHAPGTHWYHAHIHGATAIQVVNGLAGALIVEEPAGQKIEVDDEKILIMQEIIGAGGNNTPDTKIYSNLRDPIYPGNNGYQPYGVGKAANSAFGFTINSLNTPTINITTNEIQRWRVINATATPRGFMNFGIYENDSTTFLPGSKGKMNLIAVDGITFYGQSPQQVSNPGQFMAPANRADFLVQFSKPGTYQLWKKGAAVGGFQPSNQTPQILAFINVTGSEVTNLKSLPPLPGIDKRPCYLAPITNNEISQTRTLTYNVPGGNGGFGTFTIEEKDNPDFKGPQPYGQPDGMPPTTKVQLGTAEEWTLINSSGALHPFHIHVNPFQVIEVKNASGTSIFGPVDPEDAVWWDSFAIPANGGSVRIRSRFLHYPGVFVQHCHILIHEDSGMMWDVKVDDPDEKGTGPCVPLKECSPIATLPEPVPES